MGLPRKAEPVDHGAAWVQQWLATTRWRRRVDGALARLDLTLVQWLVLDSLDAVFRQTQDPVSQVQVCRRLELGKASVSRLMWHLARRGLIDSAPAFGSPEHRIYLTDEGALLLEQGRAVVEMVSGSAR